MAQSTSGPVSGPTPSTSDLILFWASFLTLIAAGMGFSIRGEILSDWGRQFGFTQTELGEITGMGLVGFGITIIAFSFFADLVGYGILMVIACFLHIMSIGLTIAAPFAFQSYGKDGAYWILWGGQLCFALANGTCEAVINPLTATLFPNNKTHWLNILHAGWPGGLVLGALVGLGLNQIGGVPWEVKWSVLLAPILLYGLMMAGRRFPRSEARASGVSIGTMAATLFTPILLFLFLMHAMVGYVELGTDSWIINITDTVLANKDKALLAFIWTNVLMFTLRFFAGPIVHQISPVGLLFVSAVVGTIGLYMLGQPFSSTTWAWMFAVTIYGIGKTFYWPTLLGVISECYPRGGALALGVSGGIGVISAGLLGGPGIGYKQDYFATTYLQTIDPAAYQRYAVAEPRGFLFFPAIKGLDNAKVGVLENDGKRLAEDLSHSPNDPALQARESWWRSVQADAATDRPAVQRAMLHGAKQALTWTAIVPAMMAVGFLFLIAYFRARGGYRAEVLTGHAARDEEFTGGVAGPADM